MREEKDGGRAGEQAGERNEEETSGKRTRLSTYVVMLSPFPVSTLPPASLYSLPQCITFQLKANRIS